MNINLENIPPNWAVVPLIEVSEIRSGYGFPKKIQGKKIGKYPFYKVRDISNAIKDGSYYLKKADNYIDEKEISIIKAKPLKINTIVFAKIGEAIKLNRRAILSQVSLVDNNVMGVNPNPEIFAKMYLYYFFNTIELEKISRATTVPSVRKKDVEQILVPLPPINEQVRIVGRVEELFSRMDAGVRSLQAAQTQLEQYRQTTLKQAYTGKYPEVNLGEIISPSKERFDPIKEQNTAYIGLANIDQDTGNILNIDTSSDTKSTKSVFHKGDLLYGRLRPYLNKVAVPDFDGVCSTDILVFPKNEQFNSNFLQQILLSHDFVDYATKNMSGVQHPRIKYDEIAKYKIPFPNICIQNQIANKIIVVFSRIDKITQRLDDVKIQSNKLKQSILKMAFEGRLVAQNPNDEPANVLLERIKNEKGNQRTLI